MSSLLAITLLGFFLGVRHATDPDHVIAISTIVARRQRAGVAALVGMVWGLGHTLTIVVVGCGIILFGWVIPARVGLSLEFSVAVMLILLGSVTLSGVLRRVAEHRQATEPGAGHQHSHPHSHGDYVHTHPHRHEPEAHPHAPDQTPVGWLDRHFGTRDAYQLLRPLIVGIVHGLAGSASVALLVLATIGNARWAVVYLLVFGLGTLLGMAMITSLIAIPFARTGPQFDRISRGLRLASGVISVAFGLFLAYRIGFVEGLFGANPNWAPR